MGFDSSMTTKKRPLASPTSPSPWRPRTCSPTPIFRISPLAGGSPPPYPVTPPPFQSSPSLSLVQSEPSSPDLFEPFEYTSDMDDDLRRIDSVMSDELGNDEVSVSSSEASILVPESLPPVRKGKTWVVFYGNVPGIYHDL